MGRKGPLVSGDELLDRRIADGVARKLVSLGVCVHHEIVDLLVRHHLHAGRAVVAEIGLGHPGRAPACRAIEEELDGADHQHVVAGAGYQPGLVALRNNAALRIAEQDEPGAHRQAGLRAWRVDTLQFRRIRRAGRLPRPCSS